MHTYSADCDCAVCSVDPFDDCTDESSMALEEVVPCSRCGAPHLDTYKWVYPMCLVCEKDMVPVR